MGRELREVVYVDGVRTAFGKAGPKGMFWRTRADDMGVKVVRELLRRNPQIEPERIGDVVMAATAQVGDQGLTLGRDVGLLAGIPNTVPGFAVDRMCAGALTAVTAAAGEIAFGAVDVAVAASTTSPIRSGGILGLRRSSARTALTPMSSALVRQNCPFGPALPKGVRTPSTKRTSRACRMACTIRA